MADVADEPARSGYLDGAREQAVICERYLEWLERWKLTREWAAVDLPKRMAALIVEGDALIAELKDEHVRDRTHVVGCLSLLGRPSLWQLPCVPNEEMRSN